jgi:tripartite-type tricarboxylate transporter receptor subunit TctC
MGETPMRRRDLLAVGVAAMALPLAARRPLLAQSKYPERPIRLVIPFPPGGVYDAVGRPWADRIKSSLGTVVVENIGGAGGSVGAAAVARAAPDGYTLLLGGGGALVITPIASSRAPFDPIRDFEPIALLVTTGLAIVVHPSLPVKNLAELVDYAKSNPGKLAYGSAGVGTVNQLTGELFKSLTGTADIVHVPYKGAGPAITDLVAGQIPMAVPNVTAQIIELHRSGKLRMLAVTSPRRLAAVPDIPTAVEQGLPGMVSQNFIGLFAPARTPQAVVAQVAQATHTITGDAQLQQIMAASGFELDLESSPDKARRLVEDEIARWTPVIKRIGLKLD